MCACCDPPRPFESAKDRWNHKHYQTHKYQFKCPECGDALSTKQKLEDHDAICTQLARNIKMLRKRGAREAELWERTAVSASDEEDKHSDSEGEPEQDEECQECAKSIYKEDYDWWCDCGYGLCAGCQPRLAFNHVCGCPRVRKSAPSKRKIKEK